MALSISQSRCFSYQAKSYGSLTNITHITFNLAIEMLFISGWQPTPSNAVVNIFQSRNRDAFHFRSRKRVGRLAPEWNFQSRNRDAFHFRTFRWWLGAARPMGFQSRNRDAFHFRYALYPAGKVCIISFQSRNRDAFHFRRRRIRHAQDAYFDAFNLAIEMLFISGHVTTPQGAQVPILLSISQSRCFSFQGFLPRLRMHSVLTLSISQSRCFSFQAKSYRPETVIPTNFQSRNRDAFHFRCGGDHAGDNGKIRLSISQSRCFSFQGAL